jgi:hypothetical protein
MQITQCPFSEPDYLQGLAHLGTEQRHASMMAAVLSRPIPGTPWSDGVGPWPYRWISDPAELEGFRDGFRDLITLTIVTQPGWLPPPGIVDARFLKHHYVYDPTLPTPELSPRARKRLQAAERIGLFEEITVPAEQNVMYGFYRELLQRRGLDRGHFDMPREHFDAIGRFPGGRFFRVANTQGTGAMACGIILSDWLQILHFVPTQFGLTWNASYLLMRGLQDYAETHGLRLLTGGMPDHGSAGLHTFKSRWSNATLPVYMICIVNDLRRYAELLCNRTRPTPFFPAYRDGY